MGGQAKEYHLLPIIISMQWRNANEGHVVLIHLAVHTQQQRHLADTTVSPLVVVVIMRLRGGGGERLTSFDLIDAFAINMYLAKMAREEGLRSPNETRES